MDDSQFWQIIDTAWNSHQGLKIFRAEGLASIASADARQRFEERHADEDFSIPHEESFIAAIEALLEKLPADELLQFDRIMERKLFDIDRAEIQQHTDGSDDGFLYCRGFIVAMGQQYYDAINATPSLAMFDWECELITYLSLHMYESKFGDCPASDISRESASNPDGWPD